MSLALATQKRDDALAAAEVTAKRAALNKAVDAQTEAQRNLAEAPPDTSPSERAALTAAVRAAGDDVSVAQGDLNASNSSVASTRETGRDAVARARAERRQGPEGPARAPAARWCSPVAGCGCSSTPTTTR